MLVFCRHRLAPLLLTALFVSAPLHPQPADIPTTHLQGSWKAQGGDLCFIHGDQVFLFAKGKLSVLGLVHYRPGTLTLRSEGKLETLLASVEGHLLRFGKEGHVRTYWKLRKVPPQVELKPFPLGKGKTLSAEQIKAIQDEVQKRMDRDQEVRKDPAQKALWASVDADNRRYLLGLFRKVGWLDVQRFGVGTSVHAAIFVKHLGDLSLNLAALPYIERDLKATGEGQIYAIVYDDTQLHLGRKQRYGTQIDEDSQGNPYVLPLEQPDKVDELLKAIGERPLATYLADASRVLYDGRPIRMATAEESQ
ncbi:MAG: hypothetical protein WAM82_05520 [Thermoanaerobaculia bacterium]